MVLLLPFMRDIFKFRARTIKDEQEAQSKNALLETLLESIPTPVVVTDLSSVPRITRANRALCRLLSYNGLEEVIGQKAITLHPNPIKSMETMDDIYETVRSGKPWSGRIIIRDSNHRTIPVEVSANPYGNPLSPDGLCATLTDLRGIEERLALETMGKFATTIGHEINNFLQRAIGIVEIEQLSKPHLAYLHRIHKALEDAGKVSRGFLSLGPKKLEREYLRLGVAMSKYLTEPYKTEMVNGYNFEINYFPSATLIVEVNKESIECLTDNLIRNAADALRDQRDRRGKISVSVEDAILDEEKEITLYDGTKTTIQGNYVVLEVSDNGPGIDPKTQSRMFDTFYSTKKYGKSTGIGLVIVKDIVGKHPGAHLTLDSQKGIGTTFKVYFPGVHERPQA